MKVTYTAYNLLGRLLFPLLYPGFRLYSASGRSGREEADQRFGRYSRALMPSDSGSPRIWIHAASVGEIGVAEPIIASLKTTLPNAAILVSAATRHGKAYAVDRLGPDTPCVYSPLDLPVAVNNALRSIQPDILVCLETEIWPNWLVSAHTQGVRTAIVNGRISVRSISRYLKVRSLMTETLVHVDRFSMVSESDAARIDMLGAPRERVVVNGNAKYDLLLEQADRSLKARVADTFGLRGDEPVFLAGSTRGGEEEIILNVYGKILEAIPDALLIIAPRHISRTPAIEALVKEKGFTYRLKTDLDRGNARRTAKVVIIDTIGELQAIYSVSTLAFCGGSLEPLGGQNVMEAAVWGKPVLYGSSMEDFLDAKVLLEASGGGLQVRDGGELYEKAVYYLSHPSAARRMGDMARKAVVSKRGAAEKHAAVILELLNATTP